jgi:hypothetical protein
MDNKLNELSKGDKTSGSQGRYDLRSKKKAVASNVPKQYNRIEKPANEVENSHRCKKP